MRATYLDQRVERPYNRTDADISHTDVVKRVSSEILTSLHANVKAQESPLHLAELNADLLPFGFVVGTTPNPADRR